MQQPGSSLFPLLVQQLQRSTYDHLTVALTPACKAYILVVSQHLEPPETIHIVVGFSILTRHAATLATGHMYMLQVVAGREEGSHVAVLLPCHVPEITHALHTGVVDVATDGGGISHLAKVECLLSVQRFKDHRGAMLLGKSTHLVELLTE